MQPLKITITGGFWDTQIYAGRLYLFTDEGAIRTINWDRAIEEWDIEPRLRLALECAFRRSDYLYSSDFSLLLHDPEIKAVVSQKFDLLAGKELRIDHLREANIIGEQDTPFPFPHSDSVIYKSQMYVGSADGLYRGTCDKRTVKPVSTKAERKWDGPSISIAASYDEIAVATGEYGLYEVPVARDYHGRNPRVTVENPCNKCSWNFQSIYCTGTHNSGWFADFEKIKREGDIFKSRQLKKVLSAEDIFGDSGFTWARQDKMYLAAGGKLKIAKYVPWESIDNRLKLYGDSIPLPKKEDVTAGSVANFGSILEFADSICIMQSDGENYLISGDPIGWRIFPKSKHYENQLHVIFEDRLELYSFNHDYFLDQEKKKFGTTHFRFDKPNASYSWHSVVQEEVNELLDEDPEADDIEWTSILFDTQDDSKE